MSQHTKPLTTLAVALIVKNEGAQLAACLDKVKDLADEIIILDSGSTDNTGTIARQYTDKFYVHADWPGFGKQRQLAQRYVTADWVLWLDADEHLTPELTSSIREVLANPSSQNTIYEVARLTWAFGRFIRHCGWYPGYVARLHPTQLTQYNDNLVHESVIVPKNTPVKALKGDLLHYTYRELNDYLRKSNAYAQAWAEQNFVRNKRGSFTKTIVHTISRFFRTYLFKAGFLDGKAGFLIAVLSLHSVFNKYAMLWLLTLEKNTHKKSYPQNQDKSSPSASTK